MSGQVVPDDVVDASGPVTSMVGSVAVDAFAVSVGAWKANCLAASSIASVRLLSMILGGADSTDGGASAGRGPVAQPPASGALYGTKGGGAPIVDRISDTGNNAELVGTLESQSGLLREKMDLKVDAIGGEDWDAVGSDCPSIVGDSQGIKSVFTLDRRKDLIRRTADKRARRASRVD